MRCTRILAQCRVSWTGIGVGIHKTKTVTKQKSQNPPHAQEFMNGFFIRHIFNLWHHFRTVTYQSGIQPRGRNFFLRFFYPRIPVISQFSGLQLATAAAPIIPYPIVVFGCLWEGGRADTCDAAAPPMGNSPMEQRKCVRESYDCRRVFCGSFLSLNPQHTYLANQLPRAA